MEELNKVEGVQATKIDFNFKMDFIAQINVSIVDEKTSR